MAAVAEMGEVDEIHSNEESIKDGVSVNGDVCGDYKEDVDDEANEMNEDVTTVSEDVIDQDQNLSDNEKTDEDDPSVQLDDLDSVEENDVDDDEIDKMDVEEIIHDEDSSEQIHEIDNSDVEEEEEESESEKNKTDLLNGLSNSDEIIIESTSENNSLGGHNNKVDEHSIIINDSGEVDGDGEDVVVLDDAKDPIENGSIDMSGDEIDISENNDSNHKESDGEITGLGDTPMKKKRKSMDSGPPRRSSRNINKEKKSYVEDEEEEEEKERQRKLLLQQQQHQQDEHSSEESESDIEEVMPQDPLAVADPPPPPLQIEKAMIKKSRMSSSTIVVKDTKCLAEIASKSTANNHNKKEPTLVIIDTNSILSGRGPVPIAQKPALPPTSISNSYSMLPMALPAQGVYPANMRATITPIPMTPPPPPPKPVPPPPPPPPVLPTLTDDMFVVEAPSFIVPYVYEKPPIKELRDFVKNLETEIAEQKKKEIAEQKNKEIAEQKKKEIAEQKRKEAENANKERIEKEKQKKEEEDKVKDEKDNEKSDESEDKKADTKEEDAKMDVDKDAEEKKDTKAESEKETVDSEKESKKEECKKEKEKPMETDLPSMPVPSPTTLAAELRKPPATYFDSPLGKFFMGIGYSLVQEAVQTDLLKQQKRKRDREGGQNPETMKTINSLLKNLEFTKENNEPYRMETKKCEFCSFKTESSLAMAFHLETPHMKNYVYRCNFCPYEVRSPHDILFHMEVQHGVRGRLERAPAFHQCPNCPFEDNQKGKLSRHLVACTRKFKPDRNLEPPSDYEPPAKIPRAPRMKQQGLGTAAAVYQAMARTSQYQMMSKMAGNLPAMQRGRGRPSLGNTPAKQSPPGIRATNMLYKQANMSGGSVLVPTNYQLSGNQLYQVVGGQEMGGRIGPGGATAFLPSLSASPNSITIQQQQPGPLSKMKPVQQPSISITPLPRGSAAPGITISKPGDSNPKNSFVICEICDGYIKDLEQLRNHMQWIHKVKIHPKMIYNRPPLNCQKCQFRFFTDQGLERHLLGSHGLVTSSMQEAANRSKDAGRCPVCGRVYQWKLLNHVARDHNMTLKPAHLSYKCTVCTATFGMYKQFESHVYSAHSVVAKRVMDKKNAAAASAGSAPKNESVLKPLKINDEITIIPQPAKPTNGAGSSKEESTPSTSGTSISVRNSIGYSNGNPGTSKSSGSNEPRNEPSSSTSLSRSERLARRKTTSQTDN